MEACNNAYNLFSHPIKHQKPKVNESQNSLWRVFVLHTCTRMWYWRSYLAPTKLLLYSTFRSFSGKLSLLACPSWPAWVASVYRDAPCNLCRNMHINIHQKEKYNFILLHAIISHFVSSSPIFYISVQSALEQGQYFETKMPSTDITWW